MSKVERLCSRTPSPDGINGIMNPNNHDKANRWVVFVIAKVILGKMDLIMQLIEAPYRNQAIPCNVQSINH